MALHELCRRDCWEPSGSTEQLHGVTVLVTCRTVKRMTRIFWQNILLWWNHLKKQPCTSVPRCQRNPGHYIYPMLFRAYRDYTTQNNQYKRHIVSNSPVVFCQPSQSACLNMRPATWMVLKALQYKVFNLPRTTGRPYINVANQIAGRAFHCKHTCAYNRARPAQSQIRVSSYEDFEQGPHG